MPTAALLPDATDPRKLTLAGDLRHGIEQNQLVLHYQPKADARTAAVLGVEAVRSTVELGRNLGLRVVAEGVEDLPTWRHLDAVGCDVPQGYYISRPISAEVFDQWLTNRTTEAVAVPS
ncbi:EAL domain-containing protein [Paractinoplanes atraurantiacus]|uniref:EAL domain-containing protein n=1 Tax=Paractinoplanes atraurantiacus TaxID=1036182 RepID=A0A285KCJ5_9ACTN|nr:EAL domain-containing protein [Actinoplanes atraurantiacus]